ncbi:MAG: hypothetical protein J2P25_13450 [Nocardiopsaceae bacterium]|nr:hypothetical protein [Nocardiopsaceae bacterium]
MPGSADDDYLPLDDVGRLYARFTRVFGKPAAWKERGHLFVVTGERGYGKARLIKRCRAWLEASARGHGCRIVWVDLSSARWDGAEGAEMLNLTVGRMLDALESLNLVDPEVRARVEAEGHPAERFHELTESLRVRPDSDGRRVVPVVLLQDHLTQKKVFEYYNAVDKGAIFFTKIFDPDEIAKIRNNWHDLDRGDVVVPHRMVLDALNPGDFRTMAKQANLRNGGVPLITEKIIGYVEERYVERESGVGPGELFKLMRGMLRAARDDHSSEVDYKHIADYYAQAIDEDEYEDEDEDEGDPDEGDPDTE